MLLDTGASPCLLKNKFRDPDNPVNQHDILHLIGITDELVKTLGKITITFMGHDTEFHLVPDDFPISQDGLLGNEFFQSSHATIDYRNQCLCLDGHKITFLQPKKEVYTVATPPYQLTPWHTIFMLITLLK